MLLGGPGAIRLLSLDELLQASQDYVPLGRHPLEVRTRHKERLWLERPDALPAALPTAGHARVGQHVEVLGHRLPGHPSALRQLGNGERPLRAKASDEPQPCLVTQRRENRGGTR